MGELSLTLCCADTGDYSAVIALIESARRWLRTKNTDQWAQPWPSEEDRSHRIREAMRAGRTWIAWHGRTPVATITATTEDGGVWPTEALADPAVYASRLVPRGRRRKRGSVFGGVGHRRQPGCGTAPAGRASGTTRAG